MPGRKRTLSLSELAPSSNGPKRRRLNEDHAKFTETTHEITRQISISVSTDRFRMMAAHMKATSKNKEVLCNRSIKVGGFEIMVRLRGKKDEHSQLVYLAVEVAVQQQLTRKARSHSHYHSPSSKVILSLGGGGGGGEIVSQPHFEFKCQMNPPQPHKQVETACGFHAIDSGYWGRHKFVLLQNLCALEKGDIVFKFEVNINLPVSMEAQIFHEAPSEPKEPTQDILTTMFVKRLCTDLIIVACQEESNEERRRLDMEQGIESEIMCHKCVLSAASPVFEAMLQSNFVESQENRIEIEDFTPRVIYTMISYLYMGEDALDMIDDMFEWDKLLIVSEKYRLSELSMIAIRHMMRIVSGLDVDELKPYLEGGDDVEADDNDDSDSESNSKAPMEVRRLLQAAVDERREKQREIYESNFLFHLLNFLAQYPHAEWIEMMESQIFALIQDPLKKLFELEDKRFASLSQDVVFKFFRDTM